MKTLDQYYDPGTSLKDTTDFLSDSEVTLEKHREDVDTLVLNLVIKYIAEYLQVATDDVYRIRSEARRAIEKSPEEILGMVIQQFADAQGQEVGVFESELFSLESLVDLRATAAIVREIIFNKRFPDDPHFTSVDLGSGTGILILASIIAARRRKIRDILSLGFEIQYEVARKSERVLASAVSKRNFRVLNYDILNTIIWGILNSLPLRFWISETVTGTTPPITIQNDGISYDNNLPDVIPLLMNRRFDPFPLILDSTIINRPGFVDDVRGGRTAMFPDIVNGLYIPNAEDSTLVLESGSERKPVRLPDIGDVEYGGYEDFGLNCRWSYDDVPISGQELEKISAAMGFIWDSVSEWQK